jgi:CRP-like cAMP-binding protein
VCWIARGDLVTGRQAKRLFAQLAAGATVGNLLGAFGSAPAGNLMGIEGIVLIAAGMYALAGLSALQLRRSQAGPAPRTEQATMAVDREPSDHQRSRRSEPSIRRIWRESALFRVLLVWSFCIGVLGPMLYFQFSFAVDQSTSGPGGEQALLSLYSQFRGWLNVTVLVIQLGVSAKLYRRFGIPLSVAVWPLAYLGSFLWMGTAMSLRAAMSSVAATRLEGDAVAKPALRILFNLMPNRFRSRATGFAEGPAQRIGGALGNTLVLGAIALGGPAIVSLPAFPLAVVWLASSIALWRLYPGLLLQAASDRGVSLGEADLSRLLDPATLRTLAVSLGDPDPDVGRAATELIAEAHPEHAVRALAGALEEASPELREVLIASLQRVLERSPPGEVRDDRSSDAVARLLEERDALSPDERADLVQIYARLTGGAPAVQGSEQVLDTALGDPEPAVRLAAIAELQRRGMEPPGIRDLDASLLGAFDSSDILARRTACKELRALLLSSEPDEIWRSRLALLAGGLERRVDRAVVAQSLVEVVRRHGSPIEEVSEAVLRHLPDPDPQVRAAVLSFIGYTGLSEYAPQLVAGLGSSFEDEARAAQDALAALGPVALEAIVEGLRFDEIAYRDRALEALALPEAEPEVFDRLFAGQLDSARRFAVLRAALDRDLPADDLLLRHIDDRVDEGLGACLCLLAAIDGDEQLRELEHRFRVAPDVHQRSILVEALESVLVPADRARLLPLIESVEPVERGAVAAHQLQTSMLGRDEAWMELKGSGDPVVDRLLVGRSAPWLEATERIDDNEVVLRTTQIAAQLHRVPGFDRLATRQLVRVAEAVREVHYAAGDAIYSEGDEDDSLYVLTEGEVGVSAEGEEQVVLGPGVLLGEIAALDAGKRAESARAAAEVTALRLDRETLLTLMSEAPGLGIGLSQFLAQRLRAMQLRLRARGSSASAQPTEAESAEETAS